jgi:hypothetical protein
MHDCPNYLSKKPQQATTVTTPTPTPIKTVFTPSEPVLKQNVGSSNSILLELAQSTKNEVEIQNTILEKILERVMEKATSNNVSVSSQGAQLDKLSNQQASLYELLELTAAQVQEIRKHFKISSFQPASMFERAKHDDQATPLVDQATQEDIDEMADTDDQTEIDSHSIHHARREE